VPGFDGTGPAGMGPMTGGARGLCNPMVVGYGPYRPPYPVSVQPYQLGYAPTYGFRRPRWGLRRGFGGRSWRGRGRGRGRGWW
jgi:hypothetical protein